MPEKTEYITISLGGSVINPGTIDVDFLRSFRDMILDELSQNPNLKIVIICGGGRTARTYIDARPEDLPPGQTDYLGIMPTWVNAQLLSAWFGEYCPPLPSQEFRNFVANAHRYRVVIGGGFLPALKTDEDAAIAADYFGSSRLLNVTNVDGVYDKDPSKHQDAKKYSELTYNEFCKFFEDVSIGPGSSAPFTFIATKICARSALDIMVVGKNVENIRKAIRGECVGTRIGKKKD